jgi:uncharacterized phage-associated protein
MWRRPPGAVVDRKDLVAVPNMFYRLGLIRLAQELDARAIANLVLREAWARGLHISNLKLQKLLFLCHAFYLVERGRRLMRGDFVAWRFGPVHREAYAAFQSFGGEPIASEAVRVNPVSGERSEVAIPKDQQVIDLVRKIVQFYGPWTASELVALTHAKNGPWDCVVTAAAESANMGLRISDNVILERFKYHWFGEKQNLNGEEPNDDRPLVA